MKNIIDGILYFLDLFPACVFVGVGLVDGFSWPIVCGIISFFAIHHAKDLIPERKVLTTAELAAFKIMQSELVELQSKMSALSIKFGFKSVER